MSGDVGRRLEDEDRNRRLQDEDDYIFGGVGSGRAQRGSGGHSGGYRSSVWGRPVSKVWGNSVSSVWGSAGNGRSWQQQEPARPSDDSVLARWGRVLRGHQP